MPFKDPRRKAEYLARRHAKHLATRVLMGREPVRGVMTQDEVAEALGCTRQNVDKLERSALRKLAKNVRLRRIFNEW